MIASAEDVAGRAFDFVIVGGGTSGLPLAARLTEDPNVSVLVLEAGPANLDDATILTPAMFGIHFTNPQYDWGFSTYHRPARSDIDAFEKLGNRGWNWNLLKKYYMKAESFIAPVVQDDGMNFDVAQRGSDGPLAFGPCLIGIVSQSLQKVGINRTDEPFSGDTKGTWLTPVSIHPTKRVRSYAANMHYQPNASRPNFTVVVLAQVTKLILKQTTGVATAERVRFTVDGKDYEVAITKEVILSAGTIMSPQILELSGIGNPSVLSKAGIDVHIALDGVGENVQEHINCGASYEIRKEKEHLYRTFDCLKDSDFAAQQFQEYALNGTGVCGMAPICMTFESLAAFSPDAAVFQKSLEQSIKAGVESGHYSAARQKQLNVQFESLIRQEPGLELILAQTFNSKPNPAKSGRKYISLHGCLNHPISRGSIHVKSNDPTEPPVIDPHWATVDLQILVEMFKFNRRVVRQEPLCSILEDVEVNPGPECVTDEQIGDWLKTNFSSTWHTVGSCSMLPLEDGGVVDTKLKVYNTTNIRVVDLSIIPLHIAAHTQATAYALGELGADIIKGNVLQA
ncbi:alcohol oxidase [Mycena galericulata]|nr:alcohol oxidase [Mycena galericulata]KAJ7491783.1 alcohol oxidase [Mycena galericulata]